MAALQQYKGKLTARQAAEGMNAAVTNAKRLADDAKLLLEAKRYPTASSVAVLSLEEHGKCAILRELLTARSDREVQRCWQRYRKHTDKNYLALLPDRVRNGARKLRELSPLFTDATGPERASLDTAKQLGFYSDCCGNSHWSVPSEVIDETCATQLVTLASALSNDKELVTAKELELWQFYMVAGPTRENLLNWCAAMERAGLKSSNYVDEMRRFTDGLP